MLQADTRTDPIVEILRLAYRRGLAIRQEQEKGGEYTFMPFPTATEPVIKRAGSPASEPGIDPSNRNGKEELSTS